MAEKEITGGSEAEIAVHWGEEGLIHPTPEFIAQANMTDPGIYKRFSLENFPNCFKEYADLLTWYEYWHTTLDTSDAPCFKWFVGGKINASYNCIDRHLAKNKNKTAIHFAPEPVNEKYEHITYQELFVRVNEFAAPPKRLVTSLASRSRTPGAVDPRLGSISAGTISRRRVRTGRGA